MSVGPQDLARAFQLAQAGQLDQAEKLLQPIARAAPDHPAVLFLGGVIAQERGRINDALQAYRKTLARDPDYTDALNNLGNILQSRGEFEEAADCFRRAVTHEPNFATFHFNLGNALLNLGDNASALASYRQALALDPDDLTARSNYLMASQYEPGVTAATLLPAHRDYGKRLAASVRATAPHRNTPDPGRPLKIGYVSPDLREHPVGHFLLPVLERHDRAAFSVHCYYNDTRTDTVTARLKSHARSWRDVTGMNDENLAAAIRADGIDILVDLAGHTGGNRLPVFGRRPAPVQASWAGYVGTTGVDAVDYLITDRWSTPSDDECTETPLRLPNGYLCYAPPPNAPAVTPLPALTNGFVTFGSFNSFAKLNQPLITSWARLLNAMPGSRLLLKNTHFAKPRNRALIQSWFEAAGIVPERLIFEGPEPHAAFLRAYELVDIALDTFPYSGGLTTMEAIWMGVPVVTQPGATFAGRHSTCHLNAAALGEFIAGDEDSYRALAMKLAGDVPRLAEIRKNLRARVAASPLADTAGFARNLEAAFRSMWQSWCARR